MTVILEKSKQDMIDLDNITKNIDREYKEPNIDLTDYEREQEESAIISYEELIKNSKKSNISYDTEYKHEGVDVKKINFDANKGSIVTDSKINHNYQVEEDFLKALKQLQRDLA